MKKIISGLTTALFLVCFMAMGRAQEEPAQAPDEASPPATGDVGPHHHEHKAAAERHHRSHVHHRRAHRHKHSPHHKQAGESQPGQ